MPENLYTPKLIDIIFNKEADPVTLVLEADNQQ